MIAIAHPLADELLGLVATDHHDPRSKPDRDASWLWTFALLAAIGALAWFTR